MPTTFTPPLRTRGARGFVPDETAVAEIVQIVEAGNWAQVDETADSRKEIMRIARGYARALDGKTSEPVRFTYLAYDASGNYVSGDDAENATHVLGVALRSTSYRTKSETNGDEPAKGKGKNAE